MTPNYNTSYLSAYFLDAKGNPLANITFNPDNTVAATPANITAEGLNYFYNGVSTLGPSGNENYADYYAVNNITSIARVAGDGNIILNLEDLGLSPLQLQQGLNGYNNVASQPITAPIVITDSSTNSTLTFDPTGSGFLNVSAAIANASGTEVTDTIYNASGALSTESTAESNSATGTLTTTNINYNPGLGNGMCTFDTTVSQLGFPGLVSSDVNGTETIAGIIATATVSGTGATVYANGAAINLANAAVAQVIGNADTITTTSAGTVSVAYNGQGGTIDLSNSSVTLAANSNATITGIGNVITVQNNTSLELASQTIGNIFTMATNGIVVVDNGAQCTVINAATVSAGNNTAVTVEGTGTAITAGASSTINVASNSNNDVVTTGANGTVSVATGDQGTVINASSAGVTLGNNTSATINGSGDTTTGGSNDVITQNGSGTANLGARQHDH